MNRLFDGKSVFVSFYSLKMKRMVLLFYEPSVADKSHSEEVVLCPLSETILAFKGQSGKDLSSYSSSNKFDGYLIAEIFKTT